MDRITKNREGGKVDIKIGVDFVLGTIKHNETGKRMLMVSIIDEDGREIGIPFDAKDCVEIATDLLEAAKHLELK
jgi:hypothetical protein